MKYFFILALVLQHVCYGFPSAEAEKNLKTAFEISKKNFDKSIDVCTIWIEDPKCLLTDKVHYLVCRANFYLFNNSLDGYDKDFSILKELCLKYPECALELYTCYEIYFK
jgi:hypothetical protein